MSSMYEAFRTDKEAERNGIIVDYGEFRITVARAGGANKQYQKALEVRTRPLRRAIDSGSLDNERSTEILRQVYAQTVVRNWEVKNEDGEWVPGIEGPEGDLVPFNRDNVLTTFNALPDLFSDLMQQAQSHALFTAKLREEAAGNS